MAAEWSCSWFPSLQVEMVAGQERTALLAEAPVIFQRFSALVVWCSKGGTIQLFFSVLWDGRLGSFKVTTFHGAFTETSWFLFLFLCAKMDLPLFSEITAVSSFYF